MSEMLSTGEVASLVNLSIRRVVSHIETGRLRATRNARGQWKIALEDANAFAAWVADRNDRRDARSVEITIESAGRRFVRAIDTIVNAARGGVITAALGRSLVLADDPADAWRRRDDFTEHREPHFSQIGASLRLAERTA